MLPGERFHRFLSQQFRDLRDLVEAEHQREVAGLAREVGRLEREAVRLQACAQVGEAAGRHSLNGLAPAPASPLSVAPAPPELAESEGLVEFMIDGAESSLGGTSAGEPPQQPIDFLEKATPAECPPGVARGAGRPGAAQARPSSDSSGSSAGPEDGPCSPRLPQACPEPPAGPLPTLLGCPEAEQAPRQKPPQRQALGAASAAAAASALTLQVPGRAGRSASHAPSSKCSSEPSRAASKGPDRRSARRDTVCSRSSRRPSFCGQLPMMRDRDDRGSARPSQWSCDSDDGTFHVLRAWEDTSWRRSRAKLVRSSIMQDDPCDQGLKRSWESVLVKTLRSSSSCDEVLDHEEARESACLRYLRFLDALAPFIMSPESKFHVAWVLLVFFFIMHDVVVIPLGAFDLGSSSEQVALSWVACCFWSADVVLSDLLTGVLDREGRVVRAPAEVAWRRLVSMRLPFDLLCCYADWARAVAPEASSGGGAGLLVSCLPLLRLLRLHREAKRAASRLAGYLRNENVALVVQIFLDIVLMLIMAHFHACIWYSIGRADDGWTASHLPDASLGYQYLVSLHWSIAHVTGEILIVPQNVNERVFAIWTLFSSFLLVSLFVSTTISLLNERSLISSKQSSQLSSLRRYLADRAISTSLTVRVQRNAQNALEECKRNAPESSVELLSMISEPLRVELHFEVHSPTLMAHGFFERYFTINPQCIHRLCHTGISHQPLSKADVAFSNLETPPQPRMYFVTSGRLHYLQDGSAPQQVRDGHWAAEAALWTRWIHCGTLRAVAECSLLVLNAEKFQHIASPFPTGHAQLYAAAFVRILNDQDRGSLTDLALRGYERATAEAFPELFRSSASDEASGAGGWGLRRTKSQAF